MIETDLSLSGQNYKVENEAFSYSQDIYDFIEVEKENISADEKNSLFPCSFISWREQRQDTRPESGG